MFCQGPLSPLRVEAESEERPQIVCYRAWDESGGLDFEVKRESKFLKLS